MPIEAKALVTSESQRFSLDDVVLPDPGPRQIAIRTLYSGVSIGTEFAVIKGKLDWGPYPLVTGYQAVGIVEHVGADVTEFARDQRVYYRANRSIALPDGTKVSGASGTHCSVAVTDVDGTHAAALLPDDVDEEAASLFVMPAVGLNGVDMANPRTGDLVVVHGAGLIGLGVIAACAHRGCRVVAVDIEADRLNIAQRLGADHLVNSQTEDVTESVKALQEQGADVVFEATGIPDFLDLAASLCRTHGTLVMQGNYGAKPISTRFLIPHGRRLTVYYPCDDGYQPFRRAVLKNMASGALPWHHVITHRSAWSDAHQLYDAINRGRAQTVLGAVIRWA